MIWLMATATLLHLMDFSVSDGGVVETGNSGQWEYGRSTSDLSEGVNVWGTVLDGNYLNQSFDVLTFSVPEFAAATRPTMVLRHRFDIDSGDFGRVEALNDGMWEALRPVYEEDGDGGFSGDSLGWTVSAFALDGFSDVSQFRLVFNSDSTGVADGWFVGSVGLYDGDMVAPQISNVAHPNDTQELNGPYGFRANAEDNVSVERVDIEWFVDEGDVQRVSMENTVGATYRGDIPGQAPGTTVSWRILAGDGEQESVYPGNGEWETFRVYLAAPSDLQFTEERRVGQTVSLGWTMPVSEHEVSAYQVRQVGADAGLRCAASPCVVPVESDLASEWQVAAWYELDDGEVLGDYSTPLEGVVYVPRLVAIDPDQVIPSERVWIRISGRYLLFREDSSIDFGPGITIQTVRLVNSDVLDVLVEVSGSLSPESRTLVIDGEVRAVFPDVLQVNTEDTAPRIVSVTPERIVQGFEDVVTMCPSAAFFTVPEVTLGDGVVLTAPPFVDTAGCVALELAAKLSAPTGERTVLLDDGARIWTATLTIRETVVRPDRGCSTWTTPSASLVGCSLVGILCIVRRQRVSAAV